MKRKRKKKTYRGLEMPLEEKKKKKQLKRDDDEENPDDVWDGLDYVDEIDGEEDSSEW
jgi:hypothetical protein